ncbi:MAG TPA: hypothetical protein VMB81_31320, partial [Candidatus Sulfotelmatobacter sp.]|nr:hypothetical protein [Candidatus Sulfotelmatobacter sp.]
RDPAAEPPEPLPGAPRRCASTNSGLEPAGTIVLDVSADPARVAPAGLLRAAAFLQYRVLRLQQADGNPRRAVFLFARTARASLRASPVDSELAARGLGVLHQRAA